MRNWTDLKTNRRDSWSSLPHQTVCTTFPGSCQEAFPTYPRSNRSLWATSPVAPPLDAPRTRHAVPPATCRIPIKIKTGDLFALALARPFWHGPKPPSFSLKFQRFHPSTCTPWTAWQKSNHWTAPLVRHPKNFAHECTIYRYIMIYTLLASFWRMKHYELKSWYFSRWAVSTRTKRVLFSVGLSRHPRAWTVYSFSQNPWTLWNHQSPSHIWVSNTVQPCSTNTPTWCKISNWPHQTALMAIGLAWPLIFQHVHPHQRPQRPHLKGRMGFLQSHAPHLATSPTGEAQAEVLLGTTGFAAKGWMIFQSQRARSHH